MLWTYDAFKHLFVSQIKKELFCFAEKLRTHAYKIQFTRATNQKPATFPYSLIPALKTLTCIKILFAIPRANSKSKTVSKIIRKI